MGTSQWLPTSHKHISTQGRSSFPRHIPKGTDLSMDLITASPMQDYMRSHWDARGRIRT